MKTLNFDDCVNVILIKFALILYWIGNSNVKGQVDIVCV